MLPQMTQYVGSKLDYDFVIVSTNGDTWSGSPTPVVTITPSSGGPTCPSIDLSGATAKVWIAAAGATPAAYEIKFEATSVAGRIVIKKFILNVEA